ncbi:MAG TPA: glycosyltransferase family 39 protein [Chitinophagaceae bacterium]|nr:glycosyltransferase family 39 protein [Chitinophagaceae bacterium]
MAEFRSVHQMPDFFIYFAGEMPLTDKPVLSGKLYTFLFLLLGGVYVAGLFVPLMDNDSAHHANIALHMYLTGDYVNLVDKGSDYLDKPHLHFWLAAWSFKIFGVTGFAYKLPSFLLTILGVYSVYRLGKSLYNTETGRLAALIMASAVSFILANNDVRMDAILTAMIAFAAWQLTDLLLHNRWIHVLGAAAGLALAFSTKGAIGVLMPGLFVLLLAISRRQLRSLFSLKWLALILLFVAGISPVLYCYYLQFNLHPEKLVRGKDHIDGVRFILFNQSTERYTGVMGDTLKQDYFFFIHTFLWAFAPWSFLSFYVFYKIVRGIKEQKTEIASALVFIFFIGLVSFSGFKLPHYLNSGFPFAAVFTAGFLLRSANNLLLVKRIYQLQLILTLLILLAVAILNFWSFQVNSYFILTGVILLLSVYFHFIRSSLMHTLAKSISLSVTALVLSFFLLNTNFYPQVLNYQGGNKLAAAIKGKADPRDIYFWEGSNSASFDFYTKTLRKGYLGREGKAGKKVWLVYYPKDTLAIKEKGIKLANTIRIKDYEITKMDAAFLNPGKRDSVCSVIMMSEILP